MSESAEGDRIVASIADDKEIALKLAKKLGHELGRWSYNWPNHWYWCHCKLCFGYVFVRGGRLKDRGIKPESWEINSRGRIGGTAIADRPVRCNGRIAMIRERCSGVRRIGIKRRDYDRQRKIVKTIFDVAGIEGAIKYWLGERP